jgi:hypothetical protein
MLIEILHHIDLAAKFAAGLDYVDSARSLDRPA